MAGFTHAGHDDAAFEASDTLHRPREIRPERFGQSREPLDFLSQNALAVRDVIRGI